MLPDNFYVLEFEELDDSGKRSVSSVDVLGTTGKNKECDRGFLGNFKARY